MERPRLLLALLATVAAAPFAVEGQQAGKVVRIGVSEYRYAAGYLDRLSELAEESVALGWTSS
jgi:hypothetical protein